MAQNYDYTTAETIQDTLLNYVMGTRKLESQERMFDREMAERQREFDINQTRLNKFFDLPRQDIKAKEKQSRQMFQKHESWLNQKKFEDEWNRNKQKFINARKANPFSFIDSLNWGDEYATAEDKYAAIWEKEMGHMKPKPSFGGLPPGGSIPGYMPPEYLGQYRSHEDLLGLINLGIMPGMGGQE